MPHTIHRSPSAQSRLIEQAYRESWSLFQRTLNAPRGVWPQWDWVVITAANERQARSYRLQIEWRIRENLLPRTIRFLIVPDPMGRKIGSGGATVNALAEIIRSQTRRARKSKGPEPAERLNWKRILILHSGGESRRLPHCSAFGKIFGRVPRELPDGRPSTLFDEFLISLSGLPYRMHEGVFVTSGDVLLLFDHSQLSLTSQGVVGIAAATPAEMGTRHGVYVAAKEDHRVQRFLHKQSLTKLRSAGAVDAAGNVAIDTGLVWFDPSTVGKMLDLFGMDRTGRFPPGSRFQKIVDENAPLNLYGDLLMPLAEKTTREKYLRDESDGRPGPAVEQMRPAIWETMRKTPFRVHSLSPVEFIHFGSTAEYLDVMTQGINSRAGLDWSRSVASCAPKNKTAGLPVLIGSAVGNLENNRRGHSVVEDCFLPGRVVLGDRCLLSQIQTTKDLVIRDGIVVHQLPAAPAKGSKKRGFVTRVYGTGDNPKLSCEQPGATFANRPWAEWLDQAALRPKDIWPGIAPKERTLWNARLFPFVPTRDESLELSLWMQAPDHSDLAVRRRWLEAPRVSFEDGAEITDSNDVLAEIKNTDGLVRIERFCDAVEREVPATDAVPILGRNAAEVKRRATAAARRYAALPLSVLQIRGYKFIADALARHPQSQTCLAAAERYEDRAFGVLAGLIRDATPKPQRRQVAGEIARDVDRAVMVKVPARIDLAGGWSDTPPFSIEYGGKVLNAAILVNGQPPVQVECEKLADPVLIFESVDLGVRKQFDRAEDVFKHNDPSDPFALHKAATVLAGLVGSSRSRSTGGNLAKKLGGLLGGGLHLKTRVALPRGSGLGTSSILAGALLTCLRVFLDRSVEFEEIYDEVLCLEQMLTTGGGWQDQVGGMVEGIKLSSTEPDLPQRPTIEPVRLSPDVEEALRKRLLLIYTGQRRLAKGILRGIMGKFMSRDPEVFQILRNIREIAVAQKDALENGDLGEVGRLMTQHWELNKRMDPGTTNPFIDHLFEVCAPLSCGGKLAGAGGGGFMILIARDEAAPMQIKRTLAREFSGTEVGLRQCRIATQSVHIQTAASD